MAAKGRKAGSKSAPQTRSAPQTQSVRASSSQQMDEKEKQALIGRCMRDEVFRKALLRDPEETLHLAGYPVDPTIVKALKAADSKMVEDLATQFEGQSSGGGSS